MTTPGFVHINIEKLTDEQKDNFKKIYYMIKESNPAFKVLSKSNHAACLWILYYIVFSLYAFYVNTANIKQGMYNFIAGYISLQIIFVFSHMKGHAKFLEQYYLTPENITNDDIFPIVYYVAFMHHNHTRKINWFPETSFYSGKKGYSVEGSRNITVAHWVSYTQLLSYHTLLILIVPRCILVLLGYELAVILLPLAHGWQHISHKEFHFLIRIPFMILENLKLIASTLDHVIHHVHNHNAIYQDFVTSGLYIKWLFGKITNNILNKIWITSFFKQKERMMLELLKPKEKQVLKRLYVYDDLAPIVNRYQLRCLLVLLISVIIINL